MTALSDLSPAQIAMLVKLDDGFQAEDSVGRELYEMRGHQFRTADSLVRMGLAEMVPGYGMRFWYRLTTEGFRVRDEGKARKAPRQGR